MIKLCWSILNIEIFSRDSSNFRKDNNSYRNNNLHKRDNLDGRKALYRDKKSNDLSITLVILLFFNSSALAKSVTSTKSTASTEATAPTKITASTETTASTKPTAPIETTASTKSVIPSKTGVLPKPQTNKINTAGSSSKKQSQASNKVAVGKKYLVEKLTYLNQTLPEKHKAKKALNLRLAHILSLIAEENFIKYEKEKCSECLKTAQDSARQSLSVYKNLDPALLKHPLLHATALFKQAYLERFLGNETKSLSQLKRIAKKKNIPAFFTARAWYNIGEIYFELYEYNHSLLAFNQVLNIQSPWKFKATYRKIWSLFNLSHYQQSIEELVTFLKSDLYTNTKHKDQFLKQKLENELVTLYSYSQITKKNLDFLYNFNKQKSAKNTPLKREQRFFDLAKALNRIGRLKDSNKVWTAYLSKTNKLEERLLAYSLMLDNDLILNDTSNWDETGKKIEKILALQKKTDKYKEEIGPKIQSFFNQSRVYENLTKDQKKRLFSLHQKYNSLYPEDVDTLLATAGLADSLKKYILAGELFRKAVVNIKKPGHTELKEKASVKQIEIAELTKKDDIRLTAYQFYIKHGTKLSLIFKAKYQIAYIAYNNKEFEKSNDMFSQLALSKVNTKEESIQELQIKSAHLSLSALDQLAHQEERLARQAGLFMESFPKSRPEFAQIYNSAVLNTVQKLVSNKDFSHRPIQASTDKAILKAWKTLELFSVKDASQKDLSSYYLDKLLLAKELLKFKQMDQSLKFLLSDKNLSKEDKKSALTWKLWLAELRFDFKEVLRIVKILNSSDRSEEHLLRLARLSELAGADPIPYYKAFVKKFPNSQFSPTVLTSLIEKSHSNKEKKEFLKEYSIFYKKDTNRLTHLILKVDKGRLNSNFIAFFTKLPFMKNSFLDSFIQRKHTIETFEKALQTARAHSLSAKMSNSRLNFKLKKWTQTINELQKKTNSLLETEDWTARIFIISHWKKELQRFYNSVMALPAPKGLTVEETKEYKNLLTKQMQMYDEQIKQLRNELKTLWSRDFLSDYNLGFKQDSVFYSPLKWELEKLAELAEGKQKEQIQLSLFSLRYKLEEEKTKTKPAQIEQSALNGLYKVLQENPFDKKSLAELLNLETERQNTALSFYLADRIEELKQKRKKERL